MPRAPTALTDVEVGGDARRRSTRVSAAESGCIRALGAPTPACSATAAATAASATTPSPPASSRPPDSTPAACPIRFHSVRSGSAGTLPPACRLARTRPSRRSSSWSRSARVPASVPRRVRRSRRPAVGINYATLPGLQTGPVPWSADDGSLAARAARSARSAGARRRAARLPHPRAPRHLRARRAHPGAGARGHQRRRPVPDGAAHARPVGRRAHRVGEQRALLARQVLRGLGRAAQRELHRPLLRVRRHLPARVPRNGKPYNGNPASIVLHAHEEIVLDVRHEGAASRSPVPPRFAFAWPPGL